MSEIKNLAPKAIWHNFYLLTQVPRPSGHLEKIQKFLLDWAKERNIEAFQDKAGNSGYGGSQGRYDAGPYGYGAAEG